MSLARVLGIVLIIFGVFALAYQGVTYTKRDTVVDVGPIHADVEKKKTVPLPPVVGVACLAGGIILVLKRNGAKG
jgi:hypothetical protein